MGLNNYSRTENVGFVALPSFFESVLDKKIEIVVPTALKSANGYRNASNDVMIVKFNMPDTGPDGWRAPTLVYQSTDLAEETIRRWVDRKVVGMSSMELVTGSGISQHKESSVLYFLLKLGEKGDSGTLLFSVSPPKNTTPPLEASEKKSSGEENPKTEEAKSGAPSAANEKNIEVDDAESSAPSAAIEIVKKDSTMIYEVVGLFHGVSSRFPDSQRKRGKISPLPSLNVTEKLGASSREGRHSKSSSCAQWSESNIQSVAD